MNARRRFEQIDGDCRPTMLLTTADFAESEAQRRLHGSREILVVDKIQANPGAPYPDPIPEPNNHAILQYTSGSTSQPRGVCLTHRNIKANTELIRDVFDISEQTIFVSWLPLFHDMGLVSSLCSILTGACSVLLRPRAFAKDPLAWLHAISRYRATHTAAPNFAYQACVEAASRRPEDLAALDLSSLKVAINGSQVVRKQTLQAFSQTFKGRGFGAAAAAPAYGLAEATLLVCARPRQVPRFSYIDRNSLADSVLEYTGESSSSIAVTSVGAPAESVDLAIVKEGRRLSENRLGEIWVRHEGVAPGYAVFQEDGSFETANEYGLLSGREYLRTGDIGFLRDGELYITGRSKECIVIRGRNLFSVDIEQEIEKLPWVERAAAFPMSFEDEALGIAYETSVPSHGEFQGRVQDIVRVVASLFGESVAAIQELPPRRIPRTSSGKLRRLECARLVSSGKFGKGLWLNERQLYGETERLNEVESLKSWIQSYSARIDFEQIEAQGVYSPKIVNDFAKKGLFGMMIPRRHGGLGFTLPQTLEIAESLGFADLGLAVFLGLNLLGTLPLLRHASEPLKEQLLPGIANGTNFCSFAFTEATSGSALDAIRTVARRSGSRWILNGEKRWIGLAGWSEYLSVFARAVDEDGTPLGPIAIVVRGSSDGISYEQTRKMGLKGIVQSNITFDDVVVEDQYRMTPVGNGFEVARDILNLGRLNLAAGALGAMKKVLLIAYEFAASRQISTGRLLDHPSCQQKLAGVATFLHTSTMS